MSKKIDTYWLYFHHTNIYSIFSAVSRAKLPYDFEIKLFMIISSDDLFSEMKKWTPEHFAVDYLEENSNLLTLKITKTIKHVKEYEISGCLNLVKIANSNVYVAISYDSLKFVKSVMLRYFNHFYSNVSNLYISSNQIKQILDKLKEETSGEIVTDRVVSYSRINNRQQINLDKKERISELRKVESVNFRNKRTKESDLRWTDEDYATSFKRAAENDQWIDKITFSVRKDNSELFFGFLARDGLFKCNKNLKLFFDTILNSVTRIGNEKVRLFKNRSRLENQGVIKPLTIEFKGNIFKDIEQNHRLVKVLSEFPKSSYTVYHGNPYLHVSLVDYCDGSSYDLWVLSEERLIIVPQLKASFSSISRFCEHIFRKFREGNINELVIE